MIQRVPGLGLAVPAESVRAWIEAELGKGGRNQEEFADDVGLSRAHVNKILQGVNRWMRLDVADRIAIATGHWLGELEEDAA